jgi:hypothetical protein
MIFLADWFAKGVSMVDDRIKPIPEGFSTRFCPDVFSKHGEFSENGLWQWLSEKLVEYLFSWSALSSNSKVSLVFILFNPFFADLSSRLVPER